MLTGTKAQTHLLTCLGDRGNHPAAHGPAHPGCLCSPSILWPLITLDMTVISWLYSQSRALSATFRSPLFFFQLCLTAWGMTNSL